MGTTIQITHECGYPLIREEIIERVDVSLELPALEPRRFQETGTLLLYWYDSEQEAEHEVHHCPRCGTALPLSSQDKRL